MIYTMNNNENSNIVPSSSTRNLRYDGWADVPVKDYAHIYSDGTNVSVLFQSREDYVFGILRQGRRCVEHSPSGQDWIFIMSLE